MQQTVETQRAYFAMGETLNSDFRIYQLKRLKDAVEEYEPQLIDALYQDLNKSASEAYMTEIALVYHELDQAIKKVRDWMRPRHKHVEAMNFPAVGKIYPTPKGVVLIMSPWNYPVQLTLCPLVAAVAAGNCCVVKPSRYSAHTSAVLKKMLEENFEAKHISVFLGGSETNQALLKLQYDHIFFTGSPAVGRVVMRAAAEHLTPVTLELGGKSPCIVDDSADIGLAARRIVWGKCLNAGQTCVAPDYVLVHKSVKTAFLTALEHEIRKSFGDDPLHNEALPVIINEKHFDRLLTLLSRTQGIVCGGKGDPQTRRIEPTVVFSQTSDIPLMEEEIFGPVLPVIAFDALDEAVDYIRLHDHPLALYLFSKRKHAQNKVISAIGFGGGCINDTVMHMTGSSLPFGGFGQSGMGQYHGKYGFDTFTHYKPVLKKSDRVDIALRYAPYPSLDKIKKLMK